MKYQSLTILTIYLLLSISLKCKQNTKGSFTLRKEDNVSYLLILIKF